MSMRFGRGLHVSPGRLVVLGVRFAILPGVCVERVCAEDGGLEYALISTRLARLYHRSVAPCCFVR
jgi:hypothetical protein